MSKETLEEVAERFYPINGEYFDKEFYMVKRLAFIEGAKWQQERMYSEEEVKHIIDKTLIEYSDYVLADIPEWFEQFKKK
jgi:hypothetical protein